MRTAIVTKSDLFSKEVCNMAVSSFILKYLVHAVEQ